MIYGRRATFDAKTWRDYPEVFEQFVKMNLEHLDHDIRAAGLEPAEHWAQWLQFGKWVPDGYHDDGTEKLGLAYCEAEEADLVLVTWEREGTDA